MTDQMAFDFTAARRADPETSRLAAIFVFPNVANDRLRVLTALAGAGAEGLTDFELERVTGIKQTSGGKRRGELRDGGFVEQLLVPDAEHPCGRRPVRRPAPSGALSQVWVLSAAGWEWVHEHGLGGVAC